MKVHTCSGPLIREAKSSDYSAIHQINSRDLGYDHPEEKVHLGLQRLINREDHCIYVACLDEKVIGYIHAYVCECLYVSPMVEILALAIKRDYQGRGVGRLLLRRLESWALENNLTAVKLLSGESRADAHDFYQKNGYQLLKRQMKFLKNL